MTPPPVSNEPVSPDAGVRRANRTGCVVVGILAGIVALCGGGGYLAFRTGVPSGADAERAFRPKVEAALRARTPAELNAHFAPEFRSSETAAKIFLEQTRAKLGRVQSVRLREVLGFRTYRGVPSYDLVTAEYNVAGDRGTLSFRATARKDGGRPWTLFRLDPL